MFSVSWVRCRRFLSTDERLRQSLNSGVIALKDSLGSRCDAQLLAMVLCEDGECSVCLCSYSRADRVPRVLHCRHTFCQPCLETMSRAEAGLLSVACPLCRRVTCVGRGLSLQEALWVDSRLWEQIPEEKDEEEAGEKEDPLKRGEDEEERTESKQQERR